MNDFALHPRLAADTVFVADWPLSRVLLMEDARYPWLVLVPRLAGLVEFTDLAAPDRVRLMEEVARAAEAVRGLPNVAKLNIGALGNLVPQLHVHVVGRNPGDPAWPGPVWGHSDPVRHDPAGLAAKLSLVRSS